MARKPPSRHAVDDDTPAAIVVHTPTATSLGAKQYDHNGRSYTAQRWLYQGRVLREVPMDVVCGSDDDPGPGFQRIKTLMESRPHR